MTDVRITLTVPVYADIRASIRNQEDNTYSWLHVWSNDELVDAVAQRTLEYGAAPDYLHQAEIWELCGCQATLVEACKI